MTRLVPVALAALLLQAAHAAELRDLVVGYDGDVYTVNSVVWFDAPPHAVYEVFADWDLSPQFSSAIVEAGNIAADQNGRRGYFVTNRGCFLFYCRSVERRGTVEATPVTELTASADPAVSDFDLSEERWIFESEDDGTRVSYSLRMTPSFWVPPLIGPYVIKRKLREDGGEALERIEAIAQARAAGDG